MKNRLFIPTLILTFFVARISFATQADDATITITVTNPGASPFIAMLSLSTADVTVIERIQFLITPKPGSVTRPLKASYARKYLEKRGYVDAASGHITLPVFGLYDSYTNEVNLTYAFTDGSSKAAVTSVSTAAFNDSCEYDAPNVLKARTATTSLSYDYILIGSNCGANSPTVIDTDGAVRWVGTAGVRHHTSQFYHNAIYQAQGSRLLRIELDGSVRVLADYSSRGVRGFHHNFDPGKYGLLLGVSTTDYVQSVLLEVNDEGDVLKEWNFGKIIRAAMVAGGDDPDTFIRDRSESWFHNNSAIYRRADDSVIVSSRENFVICVDYNTGAIKWILGDKRKKWFQYPSLAKYALDVAPETIPPSGQHTVSMGKDGTLLLMDNGFGSISHVPRGPTRQYAAARKYKLDLAANLATEVWNFENGRNVYSPFCSSVYEDAPNNYLVDYAPGTPGSARILGLEPSGETVFEYAYPTKKCEDAYRSAPIHWDRLMFPR